MTTVTSPETVSAAELRLEFTAQLRRVIAGERLTVTLYNRPVAALIPIADYWTTQPQWAREARPPKESSMKVIVSTNLSGGEGKSTCAREFAYVVASRGYRVGIIDLDPQASLTKSLGLHDDLPGEDPRAAMTIEATAFDAITGRNAQLPAPIPVNGVDIWPSNKHLSKLDGMLYGDPEAMGNLRAAVRRLQGYDYVFIDTTPVRTSLLITAVAAADHVVTPISEFKGMENLANLMEVLTSARGLSPDIGIRMFVPNRQKSRQRFYQDIQADLAGQGTLVPVAPPIEDRSAPVNAALMARLPVVLHRPTSEAAREFTAAADALLALFEQPGTPARTERPAESRRGPSAANSPTGTLVGR